MSTKTDIGTAAATGNTDPNSTPTKPIYETVLQATRDLDSSDDWLAYHAREYLAGVTGIPAPPLYLSDIPEVFEYDLRLWNAEHSAAWNKAIEKLTAAESGNTDDEYGLDGLPFGYSHDGDGRVCRYETRKVGAESQVAQVEVLPRPMTDFRLDGVDTFSWTTAVAGKERRISVPVSLVGDEKMLGYLRAQAFPISRDEAKQFLPFSVKALDYILNTQVGVADKLAARDDGFECVLASDITVPTEPAYVVHSMIEKAATSVWYGDPGSLKSFLMLHIMSRVATGTACHGRETEKSVCVCFVLEGGRGTDKRVVAEMQHSKLKSLEVAVIKTNLDIRDGTCATKMIAKINEIAESVGPVGLVTIDTWARATPGMNENDNGEIGEAVRNIDRIVAETGAHVAIVGHTGKDPTRGHRGGFALKGAVNHEYLVEATDTHVIVTNKKMKDDVEGDVFAFKKITVPLGKDSKGRDITSLVLEPDVAPAKTTKLNAGAQRLLDKLISVLGNAKDVDVEVWRKAFVEEQIKIDGVKPNTAGQRFGRAYAELHKAGKIAINGDKVSIMTPEKKNADRAVAHAKAEAATVNEIRGWVKPLAKARAAANAEAKSASKAAKEAKAAGKAIPTEVAEAAAEARAEAEIISERLVKVKAVVEADDTAKAKSKFNLADAKPTGDQEFGASLDSLVEGD